VEASNWPRFRPTFLYTVPILQSLLYKNIFPETIFLINKSLSSSLSIGYFKIGKGAMVICMSKVCASSALVECVVVQIEKALNNPIAAFENFVACRII
jgi:hypothetical protein